MGFKIAAFFAFLNETPPSSDFVSISVSTPWVFSSVIAKASSQHNLISEKEILPLLVSSDYSEGFTTPTPLDIHHLFNERLRLQKAAVVHYPVIQSYEIIMDRLYWSIGRTGNRIYIIPYDLREKVIELLALHNISNETLGLNHELIY